MPPSRCPAGLRAALWLGAPTLVLVALTMLPVVLGRDTLVLRDVLEVHLMLKAPLAAALRDGVLPLLDPWRSGGQPLLGNPNAVPLYPDNVLFVVAPVLWALNAHFWLHWLLAPLAVFWLGRSWGLGRGAAWAGGVCYGVSGYFLSQLNLYNLVAGAALAPALVAACLRAIPVPRGERGEGASHFSGRRGATHFSGWWAAPAAGLLWAMLLLAGDPMTAALGGALAAGAVLVRHPRGLLRLRAGGALLAALVLGTLVALPQIVELLRILPASFRGHWGYGDGSLAVGAWRPVHALEWLVPLPFGRFDLRGPGGFWGGSLFGGALPIFLSLYPGLLALGLVAASGRPRSRAAWWAWGAVGAGLLLSTGGGHPLGRWLLAVPGAEALRYPVKCWLLVAVGAALLCGLGWERCFGRGADGFGREAEGSGPRSPRRLGWALSALGLLLAAVAAWLLLAPGAFDRWMLASEPGGWPAAWAAAERGRWLATLVISAAVLAGLALALLLVRRRPLLGAALLLAVHAGGQLQLLRPLLLTEAASRYREPPPALAAVPAGSRVAHAGYEDLFGRSPGAGALTGTGALTGAGAAATGAAEGGWQAPDRRALWSLRQDFASLAPPAGILHGHGYELAPSPEGLDSFLSRVAARAVAAGPTDADRVRALGRWGVDRLAIERPLEEVPATLAELVGSWRGPTAPVLVYRLPGAAPEALFAERELRVPHLNAAWELFRDPGFDPDLHVLLPGEPDAPAPELTSPPARPAALPTEGPEARVPQGRLRVLASGAESLELETASPVPGVVVVQRTLLPLWRAAVDGAPAEVEPANLYRMGVWVPAGRHRVRLWVDRDPLRWSLAGSAMGLAGLAALAFFGRRRRPERADERLDALSAADSISGP